MSTPPDQPDQPDQPPTPRVEVHDDAAALATAVAGELLTRISELQAAGTDPDVALTGGTIAGRIHAEAARMALADGGGFELDFDRVTFWFGDERFVAGGDDDRNDRQARSAFLDPVGATRVHPMPATDDGATLEQAATAYADLVRAHGRGDFDVLMLGVGPDGHVASLFPGQDALDVDDAICVGVPDSPKPPPARLSLTFPALNRSRAVWFLVSGEEKALAVAAALATDGDRHTTPARGVRGHEETIWFLDAAAASQL